MLAKRRDSSVMETPETLGWPETELSELDLSFVPEERDLVFSPEPETETHWSR